MMLKDPTRELNTYSLVKYTLAPYPRQVKVETARACSQACRWCHAWGEGRSPQRGFMSWDLFKTVVDDIATWEQPLKEIVPTNFGELMLYERWEEALWYIARKLPKTEIALVTTGTLLNDENLEKLACVPTLAYVNMSLNAFFPETWARQHRRPAKLMARAVQAVHRLRDRRPDLRVNVSMVYDQALVTEFERDVFEEYWRRFGKVTVNQASYAGWPERKPKQPVVLPCRSVFDGLTVFDDGSVGTGCCF